MKKRLVVMVLVGLGIWSLSAQNLQRGSYGYLYCHMSDNGEFTAYALSRDGLHYHDLNLNVNFKYRMQNALNRNIQTAITTATGGATAYTLQMTANYTFSRLLTLSGFLDWQRNVPLVSQSSYPTTTADFGVSMKFSLTR